LVDRAQAVAPSFALSPDTAPAVAHICRRLDGVPLAIELAAARLNVLSIEQISARLDDRFQLLTGGSRTAVARQQTLRATNDWSYDLLADAERRLLRGLSVFAGGCSLDAAEQVCTSDPSGDSDTIELLSHLIDKSLVVVEDDSAGGRRYRLLETVRQYARDRLIECGAAAVVRDRHLRFFYDLALEAEPELPGPNQVACVRRLDAEHDNLRAALEWCLETSAETEVPLRLVCALWRFWMRRCYFSEGRQWIERALAAGSGTPRSLRARALVAAADLSYFQGDWASVQAFAEQVVALDKLGLDEERWTVGFALFLLAIVAMDRGDLTQATALAERSLAVAREVGHTLTACLALIIPSYAARQTGRHAEQARALIEEALALLRPLGDKWTLATLLFNLSDVLLWQGQPEQAAVASCEGLVLSQELADQRSMTWCLTGLANAAAARNQLQRAARLWGAVDAISQSIGSPVPSTVRASQDIHLPAVRQAMGDERFGAAWAEGRKMTPDEVVAYALQNAEPK